MDAGRSRYGQGSRVFPIPEPESLGCLLCLKIDLCDLTSIFFYGFQFAMHNSIYSSLFGDL